MAVAAGEELNAAVIPFLMPAEIPAVAAFSTIGTGNNGDCFWVVDVGVLWAVLIEGRTGWAGWLSMNGKATGLAEFVGLSAGIGAGTGEFCFAGIAATWGLGLADAGVAG